MKKSIIKFFDNIIVLLLATTGLFIGCDKNVDTRYGMPSVEYGPAYMYGVLQSEYEMKVAEDTAVNMEIIRSIKSEETE